MKTYSFKKITCRSLDISDVLWRYIPAAHLDCYNLCEKENYPKTIARGVYSDKGLTVYFESDENPDEVLARYTDLGDPAYKDSCVEIFFNPDPENDKRYFNFEISAGGALRLGLGTGRNDKIAPKAALSDFEIQTEITKLGWKTKIFIPFTFVKEHFNNFSPVFSGNFQKCGDETPRPHFPTWNKIDVPAPDFHRPEFFGRFILE